MTFRQFAVFLLWAAALFSAGPAPAQSSLPRPFAPWMAFEDSLREQQPVPPLEEAEKPRAKTEGAAASRGTERPAAAPEDTVELTGRIYGKTDEPSALELGYSRRAGEDLVQFGYDMFGREEKEKEPEKEDENLPAGAVQESFLLNIGDRLNVTFRGQRQDGKTYTITGEGQIIIDELPPIPASGRSIGDLREAIESEARKLHNTEVFVSLESVRQVSVLVVGHVRRPGRQTMTVFHTVLDALMGAGGIEKTGSLRQVRLVRQGRSTIIDLYSLLIHGSAIMDIGLRDGDRIIIPPIGPAVAVAGGVKRPGIYEILPAFRDMSSRPAAQVLSMDELLAMAGGILSPGRNRLLKLGLADDGREKVDEISDPLAPQFTDGGILMVAPAAEARTEFVGLAGHTRRPGVHALESAPGLSALLDDARSFGPDIYPLIGVIERRDSGQMAPQLISFPPLLVVQGQYDQRLQDGDTVRLFSRKQVMGLQKKEKKLLKEASYKPDKEDAEEEEPIDDPVLMSFLRERSAFVRGAVRAEGPWPVAEGISLENIIAAAGGMTLEASAGDIEVTTKTGGNIERLTVDYRETDPSAVMIGPGDSIRVRQKFARAADSSVLIMGAVLNPGRYDLVAGDRLSDLLRRAGGVMEQGYPDGAIFSRESERRAEEARFRSQAQELELRLAAAMNRENEPDTGQIASVQELVTQLRNAEAVGRITVEADPGALAAQPELDILLEPGDRIFIPQRPLTVRVAGEILSPAALQFRKDKDPRDYISEAGGFTHDADKDRVFVLYPDGSAQPLLVNAWNHTPAFIPPGSTVVVPRDPKPFDFIQTAKDVSQILSNLAITGIFIDDIKNED